MADLVKQAEKGGIKKIVVGVVVKHGPKVLILHRKPEDFMGWAA